MVLYSVEITRDARREIKNLPGNMRQRILALLKGLQENPRPSKSKQMDLSKIKIQLTEDITFYRIRIESWRVVYAIEEDLKLLTVLAVRKRPPYQYDDLLELIDEVLEIDPE